MYMSTYTIAVRLAIFGEKTYDTIIAVCQMTVLYYIIVYYHNNKPNFKDF